MGNKIAAKIKSKLLKNAAKYSMGLGLALMFFGTILLMCLSVFYVIMALVGCVVFMGAVVYYEFKTRENLPQK